MRFGYIGDEITKCVYMDHFAFEGLANPDTRPGTFYPLHCFQPPTQPFNRHSGSKMSCDRGEDVPSMEGVAHIFQKIFPLLKQEYPRSAGVITCRRKDAVVGPDKEVTAGLHAQGRSFASHSRIDNGHVDRSGGEIGIRPRQQKGSRIDVLWLDGVTQIDDSCGRGYRGDHPFHDSNIRVRDAKVGKKGDAGRRLIFGSFERRLREARTTTSFSR